ncbi:MAG: glycoside hydrolase family 15 protein [Pseudomonadota bacterium]
MPAVSDLNLGMIGNCSYAALIDTRATVVWCCLPRFDSDAIFNALINGSPNGAAPEDGLMAIELEGLSSSEQSYRDHSAILRTVLHSPDGSVEVIDFAPRFYSKGRAFRPHTLVRRIRPLSGSPRIRIKIRPTFAYGRKQPTRTRGSNHIRFISDEARFRLTTDAPVDYVLDETTFTLTEPANLIFGPDESLSDSPHAIAESFDLETQRYWRNWSRRLALPLEWQDAVIRAAITLKLCSYEETGAIIAAVTTSIPEAPGSGRNWDYRFCWIRDAFFVVRALNSLAAIRSMENYFGWMMNVIANAGLSPENGRIQPVLGIGLETELMEQQIGTLSGYRGMRPVRVGNQAHEHEQFDVYGNVVLGAAQAFMDRRMARMAGITEFERLEHAGTHALKLYDQPDAGMWELRSRSRVHTSSSLMCWAACDRLAKIAQALGLPERARFWAEHAKKIRAEILERCWSGKRNAFVESFDGEKLDASVLLMAEVGFIDPMDPRFVSTVERISEVLGDGVHVKRYEDADDFGHAEMGFNICAFWRLDALARIGRQEEAREVFEELLAYRNPVGLMSEDTDTKTGELWGNFPQTYSMVGIINSAMRLSRPWESVV